MSSSVLSIGIVGLPNVGKSTLFNALLRRQVALAANYPFATIEPNVGIVEVPDSRLLKLAKLIKNEFGRSNPGKTIPEKVTYATVKFVDIAGLVKGASKGEGLGNQFLSHIREVDAIVQVVRDFDDENVVRAGSKDPQTDIEVVNTELILADLQTLEKQKTEIKGVVDKDEARRADVVLRLRGSLNRGILAKDVELSEVDRRAVKNLNLLTLKPIIYILNVSEDKISGNYRSHSEAFVGPDNSTGSNRADSPDAIRISAKIEAELSFLAANDQKLFMREYGMTESGLDKVIKKGFETLGLQTFLTAGPKEVRAWTIKKGSKAPQAAGVIHTDFERGFISAEIVTFEDLIAFGSYQKARDQGKIRLEGKEYVMRDGDIVEFRFSV